MKDTIKVVDITIQRKFKEFVDARKEGRTYDFMIELKKELEATLQEQKNNEHVEKIENLLQEIEMRRIKNSYIQ